MKKLLMLLLAFMIVAPVFAAKLDPETSVMMTKAEREAFNKLKSDTEQEQFVKDFWAKRDPSPETPSNEYRTEIQRRVKEVASLLRRTDAWETDMGQALILLGPPNKQENAAEKTHEAEATWYPETDEAGRDASLDASESVKGEPKRILTYQKLPQTVSAGEVKIEFLEKRGKWSFKDSKKGEDLLDKMRENDIKMLAQQRAGGSAQSTPANPSYTTTTASPTREVQQPGASAPIAISPEVKGALDATINGTAPKAINLGSMANTFQTSEGEMFATVAVNASGAGPGAKAGVRVQDSSGKVVHENELPFESATEASGYFQTKVPIPAPGEYTISLVVANGNQAGGVKHTLTVPDSTNFSISSVILSKKFSQLPEAKPEKEPYTFGKIKIHPSVDGEFGKTDDLIIVYEAYNFQMDAAGKPNLEAVYTFQPEGGKGKKTPPGSPNGLVIGKKITISTSYPLQNFPAGNYKLIVDLTDKTTGQKATKEASFQLK